MEQKEFTVKGMMCEGCSGAVERVVSSLPGVQKARVILKKALLIVDYNPQAVSPESIAKAVSDAGYEMIL
ncbi:hypothetical protein HR11_07835 [Porphyromonas macacae]|uniref:Copper-ion-binding protein n=1 Tax=Porphyromonas macacae TaxID=28115 RepID=A0A379EA55_9PORP|nr:heavy metal-associated domain-containing protein [Porphyromonas macacae]KGO00097.1 hypothetical protein HR11_07835 [Porphyromonas macacae]SUB89252.1 Copper-ion-binding protein [Porphyromonas macacae]